MGEDGQNSDGARLVEVERQMQVRVERDRNKTFTTVLYARVPSIS